MRNDYGTVPVLFRFQILRIDGYVDVQTAQFYVTALASRLQLHPKEERVVRPFGFAYDGFVAMHHLYS